MFKHLPARHVRRRAAARRGLKTASRRTILVDSYFASKSPEHDVSLTFAPNAGKLQVGIDKYERQQWHEYLLMICVLHIPIYFYSDRLHGPLTRAGSLLGAERAGPGERGCLNTPRLTRLMGLVATRDKRHSKERQNS